MVARASWGDRVDNKRATVSKSTPPKARAAAGASAPATGIEEMFVQNETVSLCLLLNRRTKTMRVIDFRAGPSHAKRLYVLKLAKREAMEKIYTLVERDEVGTWMKLGFAKEANVPGFYKRSDAFLLGTTASEAALHIDAPLGTFDDDDDDDIAEKPSPAHDFAEKTLAQAKKQVKALLDRQLPPTKMTQVKESEIQKTVDKAVRTGRALTAFEPFGRDATRRYFVLSGRGSFELVVSTESQSCFGNAFLELLTAPTNEAERLATMSAVRTVCDKLLAEGAVSCFALVPSDDLALTTAFVFNGFRRTGLLVGHLLAFGQRKDAIVFSRKLANPTES
jgi:hypothetical protein